MSDLVERLATRADEIPIEVSDRENACEGCCGPFGTSTYADFMDDPDRLIMKEAADRITALEAQVAAADRLADAGNRGLNFIENTESEMGEPLESGNALRAALAAYLATKEPKA